MNTCAALILSVLGATVYTQQAPESDSYLAKLHGPDSNFLQRLEHVVADSVGTPYHDGPLGEGPGAPYDEDPLIDLSRVDCVTFVEQSIALASASSLADATKVLQGYRYKNGQIDFLHRNHFMLVDWTPNNPWCLESTAKLNIETKTVTRSISKAAFFRQVKAPELGQDIPDRDVTVTYIPIEQADALAKAIKKPSLVVFIGHVDWLFALHCGIFLPDDAGSGKLYHASSTAGKVAAMKLESYAASQSKRYLGMAVYQISDPSLSQTGN
jgi:D-alanyl-D-alanine carboxypeptidase/D-alanyl-D-alanine-endopeptidase (penicillin-binding protein 4)